VSSTGLLNRACTSCGDNLGADGICTVARDLGDGLSLRCVGDWATEKVELLTKYFAIFTNGMKDKWPGKLNYIEICSGPGRCIVRNQGEEFDGTSLAILKSPGFQHINRAVFIDLSPSVVRDLNQRIQALGPSVANKAYAVLGDYTDPAGIVAELKKLGVHPDTLNLLFIDPTDCSVPFTTMRYLKASLGRTDIILNFPFGMDLNRNIKEAILSSSHELVRTKYLAFLGDPAFFDQHEVVTAARIADQDRLKRLMNEKYLGQLRSLGYQYQDEWNVRKLYFLCFLSAHQLGLKFWKEVRKTAIGGQFNLGFD